MGRGGEKKTRGTVGGVPTFVGGSLPETDRRGEESTSPLERPHTNQPHSPTVCGHPGRTPDEVHNSVRTHSSGVRRTLDLLLRPWSLNLRTSSSVSDAHCFRSRAWVGPRERVRRREGKSSRVDPYTTGRPVPMSTLPGPRRPWTQWCKSVGKEGPGDTTEKNKWKNNFVYID